MSAESDMSIVAADPSTARRKILYGLWLYPGKSRTTGKMPVPPRKTAGRFRPVVPAPRGQTKVNHHDP